MQTTKRLLARTILVILTLSNLEIAGVAVVAPKIAEAANPTVLPQALYEQVLASLPSNMPEILVIGADDNPNTADADPFAVRGEANAKLAQFGLTQMYTDFANASALRAEQYTIRAICNLFGYEHVRDWGTVWDADSEKRSNFSSCGDNYHGQWNGSDIRNVSACGGLWTSYIVCGSPLLKAQCNDGLDNDGDGATDYPADFSCSDASDTDETNPKAQCQDGVDNDGDGRTDYPADPGCSSKQDNVEGDEPQCQNNIDDDGDGVKDYPADFSCSSSTDNDETNPKAQCQDGVDNDGDGRTDYPLDPGCSSNQDNDEKNPNGPQCDNGRDDDNDGRVDYPQDPGCTDPTDNDESEPQCSDGIDNDNDGATDYPADFSCSSATDTDETNPKAKCQDGIDNDGDSLVDYPQDPGCSSKQDDDESGGAQCQDGIDNDNDGAADYPADFSCSSVNDNDETNPKAQCQDGIDNDGDGATDYPNDFSCSSKQDNDETNPKAACQDSLDNDGDGLIDYPQDSGCSSKQDTDESNPIQCSDGLDNDNDGAVDYPNDFSCSSSTDNDETNPKAKCQDGIDNDGDSLVDYPQDPGCSSKQDDDESGGAQCQDGLDNDNDGAIDFPSDFSCSSSNDNDETNPKAQCQDGIDNDGDGATDYPNDFSCSSKQDNDETNPKAQCQDGLDNDGDGLTDYPNDPGCASKQDNMESDACPANAVVEVTFGSLSWLDGDGAVIINYKTGLLTFETRLGRGELNGVLYPVIRLANGQVIQQPQLDSYVSRTHQLQGTWGNAINAAGAVTNPVPRYPTQHCGYVTTPTNTIAVTKSGDVVEYALSDGQTSQCGPVEFKSARLTITCASQCGDGVDNDGDGATDYPNDFSCSSVNDSDETNPKAACQDGVDNDGDGLVDFPNDPGCSSKQDNDEANAFQCSDGIDNDGDGATDYPNDFSCSSATDTDETNPKAQCQDGIDNDGDGATDYPNDFSCSSKQDNDETNPKAKCQNGLDDDGDSLVDYPQDPGCGNKQDDDESNVTQCSDGIDNDGDGATDYPNDFSCSSPTDNDETNPKAQCQDGIDNDGDGATDYPNDFSCSSKQDNDETNPKAKCQNGLDDDGDSLVDYPQDPGCGNKQDDDESNVTQCSDGIDNDGDGATDYPNDFSCSSATDTDETNPKAQCQDGLDNDGDGATDYPNDIGCSSKQDNDEVNQTTSITLTSVVVNGCDVTVSYSKQFATCAHLLTPSNQLVHSNNIFCGNNGPVTAPLSQFLPPFAVGQQVKLCNGNNYGECSSTVTVTGGGSCNPQCNDGIDNDADGATDYPNDFSCSSTTDTDETNPKAQCQDGLDNDGDGLIDHPQDPGCTSKQDNDESGGAQCQDGIDNDGDGATDFPADFSCSSVNDNDETNPKSQCQDGLDNDGDGKIDYPTDPGCSSKQDNDESPVNAQCSDGTDNDGDGAIDFPNDFSCSSATDDDETNPKAQCQDGLDNDGDGATDYPNDFSCSSLQDNDETNPKAQCQDGIDNDGDGLIDYPQDTGCTSKQDNDELPVSLQCSDGLDNDNDGAIDYPNDFSCSSATDNDETLPKAQCQDGLDNDGDGRIDFSQDAGCSSKQDNAEDDGQADLAVSLNGPSNVTEGQSATYTVTVTNFGPDSATKPFSFRGAIPTGFVFSSAGSSANCAMSGSNTVACSNITVPLNQSRDFTIKFTIPETQASAPGLLDRLFGVAKAFAAHLCNTVTQFQIIINQTPQNDPNGGNNQSNIITIIITCVPAQCQDGIDNDGDGATDFPNDFSCSSATDNDETNPKAQCQDGLDNDGDGKIDYPTDPGCASKQDNDEFNQSQADLTITKAGPPQGQPGGTILYTISVTNLGPDTAQNVVIADVIPSGLIFNAALSDPICVLNGSGTTVLCNNFSLTLNQSRTVNIAFTVAQTLACGSIINNSATVSTSTTDPNSGNNQSGTTATTLTCNQCSDGVDNDADGATDFPNDFSCSSATDNDETNPKAQCQDGIDNDNDGLIDFPNDPGCSSKQDNDEFTPTTITLASVDVNGCSVTVNYTKQFTTCAHLLTTSNQPLHTANFFCANSGPVVVNTSDFLSPFAPGLQVKLCNGNDYNECSPVITVTGGGTCAMQCSDGLDNDGDGATDYPNDFSCSSATDNDELNPKAQCQDGLDNDGDGKIDFPADPGCTSNQDNDEGPVNAQCNDGLDNDNDGATDFPNDFSCSSATDDDETNPKAQCQDGIDNDNDGLIDYPLDPGCSSKQDNDETNAVQCSDGIDNDADGATDFPNDFSCSSATDNDETLPKAQCQDGLDNDNDGFVDFPLDPGCTSKQDNDESNAFQCSDGIDNDADGATDFPNDFSCSSATDNDELNPKAQCQDGIDNDNDGLVDFPNDPGCSSKQDNNEFNPPPPPCTPYAFRLVSHSPVQGSYVATNIIGAPDALPNTPTWAGGIVQFGRVGNQPGFVIVEFAQPIVNGSGPDIRVHLKDFLASDNEIFEVLVSNDGVNFTSLGLSAPPTHTTGNLLDTRDFELGSVASARFVKIVNATLIDPYGGFNEGPDLDAVQDLHSLCQFQCSDGIDNDNDGATDFPNDFSCSSATDNDETLPKAQCQDGIDNDNDGLVDFPQDPGCTSQQDNSEMNAFQCSNGIDDDADGATDYPADFSCSSPTDNDETLPKAQCQDGLDNDNDGLIDFPQDPGCTSKQDNDETNSAQCSDGLDNDGDGATDYPNDFSCSSATDNDETLPKAQCQDGLDNDGDGRIDFPLDAGCSSFQDNAEDDGLADLAISLNGPVTVMEGGTAAYTVRVTNFGPDGATKPFSFRGAIPNGFVFTPTGSSSDCTASGNTVTCTNVTLLVNQSKDFTINFSIPATQANSPGLLDRLFGVTKAFAAHLCNTATQFQVIINQTPQNDPNGGNNQSNIITIIILCQAPQCSDGLDNDGDGATDYPNDFSCSSATDNDETLPKAQCQDGIDNDGDGKIDYPQDPGCTSLQDNDELNQAQADLMIVKSGSPQVQPGGTLLYTVTATNLGPDTAQNVVIADVIPSGLIFNASLSDSSCVLSGSGTSVLCNNLTLTPSGSTSSKTVIIAFTVPQTKCGTIENEATVSTSTTDPNSTNNKSAKVTTTIQCNATFTIAKTDNATEVAPGGNLTYVITVTNTSSVNATGVSVTDTLPTGMTFTSASSGGAHSNGVVTWSNLAINAGQFITLTVTGQVGSTVANNTVLTNTAQVVGGPTGTDTTTVKTTQPTFTIAKTDNATEVAPGGNLTYVITVTNTSSVNATGVSVTDTLPTGMTFTSATSGGAHSNGVVTWSNLAINAGQFITLTVTGQVGSTVANNTVLTNTAQVTGGPSATDTTTVKTTGQLTITKSDGKSTAAPGETLPYTITLTNSTSTAITGLTVTDTLPSGVTFLSTSDSGTLNGQTVTWTNITVPANGSKTITLQVIISSGTAGGTVLTNTVSASGVSAQDTTTVSGPQNVTIDIRDSQDPVRQDESFFYTIVVTNPSSTSTTVTVTQSLDSDTTFQSASNGGSLNGSLVTWNSITIPGNSSTTLTTSVRVRSSVSDGEILNSQASVLSSSDSESTRVDNDDNIDDRGVIAIDITDSRDPVEPGESFSYQIRVRNTGNSTRRVDVEAFLDDNVEFVSATDSGRESGNDVEWQDISIGSNSSRLLTVQVRVDSSAEDGDSLRTRARTEDDEDTELTDVRGEGTTTETGSASATVDKQADRPEAFPGDTVFYTITVQNNSSRSLSNVVVEDIPSPDLIISNVQDGGSQSANQIRWSLGTIAANSSRTMHYQAQVSGNASHGQVLHNSVVVRGSNFSQANDSYEIRVIEQVPQTGFFGSLFSQNQPEDAYIRAVTPEEASTEANPVLPFILWTTIISMGLAAGGLLGRRFLY